MSSLTEVYNIICIFSTFIFFRTSIRIHEDVKFFALQGVPHQYGLHQYDFHQYEFQCYRYKIRTNQWNCYVVKFILVGITQPISTRTNFTTQQSGRNSTSTNFIPIALKFVLVEIVLVETVLVGDPLYTFAHTVPVPWRSMLKLLDIIVKKLARISLFKYSSNT